MYMKLPRREKRIKSKMGNGKRERKKRKTKWEWKEGPGFYDYRMKLGLISEGGINRERSKG